MGFGTITIDFCPDCCKPCGLPDVMNATIAGLISCGCVDNGGTHVVFDSPAALNGTFTGITRTGSYWRKELGVVQFSSYEEECFVGTPTTDTSYWTLFIVCTDAGDLVLVISGSQLGYPTDPDYTPVLSGGFVSSASPGVPFDNGVLCNGVEYLAEGTGQIDIP